MTIRPRAARNLRDVRSRLRDIAAASHSGVVAARDSSRDLLAGEERQLEEHLDDAHVSLAAARTVHDLDRVTDAEEMHRLAILDARAQFADATSRVKISEVALRERARQLRGSERLVERLERDSTKREASAEQRAHDDLSARRR